MRRARFDAVRAFIPIVEDPPESAVPATPQITPTAGRPEVFSRKVRLDAARSPARAIPERLLRPERYPRAQGRLGSFAALEYDATLRWLCASDRVVSDRLAEALLEVKDAGLHIKEGHARFSTYLRAWVGMTARWCQQEIRRVRELRSYPALSEAWRKGEIGKSALRVILRVVNPQTEAAWVERGRSLTVRALEELARQEREEGAAQATGMTAGQGVSATGTAPGPESEAVGNQADEDERERRHLRVIMAPPGVAALFAQAVELARKVHGYQIGTGRAVEAMSIEVMTSLNEWPDPVPEDDTDVEPLDTCEQEDDDTAGSGDAARHGVASQSGGVVGTDGQIRSDGGTVGGDAARSGEAAGGGPGTEGTDRGRSRPLTSMLGDQEELEREMGRNWAGVHEHFEKIAAGWPDGPGSFQVLLSGAPPEDSPAHERVVFWSAAQLRLDAVRGRLLRLVDERLYAGDLRYSGLGQYVREQLGLSLREARELIRLDRALKNLPVAFRMYAAGRLGKRAAWQVSQVATGRTDRNWTRFALTHTLRLLEAVVERELLLRDVRAGEPGDGSEAGVAAASRPGGQVGAGETNGSGQGAGAVGEVAARRTDGEPPSGMSFPDAIRTCSQLKGVAPGGEPTARIQVVLDHEQELLFRQASGMIRAICARSEAGQAGGSAESAGLTARKPDWFCLAVMAQHFVNCYAQYDRQAVSERLRRMLHRLVIERDQYTCGAPECLQRGNLESDHAKMRSRGGPDAVWNLWSLCTMEHRLTRHQHQTLQVYGKAPDELTVRMGSRVYRNDRIVEPAFDESVLEEDPWEAAPAEGRAEVAARPAVELAGLLAGDARGGGDGRRKPARQGRSDQEGRCDRQDPSGRQKPSDQEDPSDRHDSSDRDDPSDRQDSSDRKNRGARRNRGVPRGRNDGTDRLPEPWEIREPAVDYLVTV